MNSKICLTVLTVAAAVAAAPASAQERLRAYVLIEAGDGANVAAIHGALGSLSNCKALVESFAPGETVAHIDCSDRDSLTRVVTEEIPGIEGVARASMWAIDKPE